jgi:LPXTG-motif cell wall-anchored protein
MGSFVVAQSLDEEYKVSNATIAGLITSIVCLTGYLTFKRRKKILKGEANSAVR